jgi:hypothetical protein
LEDPEIMTLDQEDRLKSWNQQKNSNDEDSESKSWNRIFKCLFVDVKHLPSPCK